MKFRKIAGNVILAAQTKDGEWLPVYIGQIRNFDERFAVQDLVDCAKNNGVTHVHTHFSSPDEPIRTREANDLIARLMTGGMIRNSIRIHRDTRGLTDHGGSLIFR